MKVIDCITYNGERELFDLRYNILKDFVDEFIVVEFDKTFSGIPKNRTFTYNLPDKVKYFFVEEPQYSKYKELAESSPNTKGAEHWKREFMQKESIKDCLTQLGNNDYVFIGDCDEIWNPQELGLFGTLPEKIKLQVYTYWLNNESNEEFWGTIAGYWKGFKFFLKDTPLNHIRTTFPKGEKKQGWHFTSMHNSLAKKLEDSYTKEDYANDTVMQNLEENIKNNRDFLGREFTYEVDESDWPQYLKDNREKYKHLLK